MADKVFIDTNIFLRALLVPMEHHQAIDEMIKHMLREGTELWISGQVIREFIVQATHPKTLKTPLSNPEVILKLKDVGQIFKIADETIDVRSKLLELLLVYPTQGKQVHDANIVATMLVNRIDTLFTLNIADFNRYGNRIRLMTL